MPIRNPKELRHRSKVARPSRVAPPARLPGVLKYWYGAEVSVWCRSIGGAGPFDPFVLSLSKDELAQDMLQPCGVNL